MPTASTLPVLILIALLWRLTKGEVLSIVLFMSAFTAASALNLGALGIEPWLMAFVLCVSVKLMQGIARPKLTRGVNSTAVVLLLLFVFYAVGSAIFSPFLFKGVTVVRANSITPLTWSTSNLAQSFYLLVAAALYLLTLTSPVEELLHAVEWYIRACITVSFLAMYQLANGITHVPYPDVVFYSNPSYAIYHAYKINGMWRLNGTFCEASEMAGFLIVGIALLGWELITRPVKFTRAASFALMVVSLLMTLSSLGYASLVILSLCATVFYAHRDITKGISPLRFVGGVVLLGVIISFCTLSKEGVQVVDKVITSTLLEKSTSDSYRERTETHEFAIKTLADTDYIGAGWGSLRASGLAFIMLGTLGIPGTMLFASFYFSLFKPFFYKAVVFAVKRPPSNDLFARSLFAATMLLCSMLIAGSEPVMPILWILFGIATVARPRAAQQSVPRMRGLRSLPVAQPQLLGPATGFNSRLRSNQPRQTSMNKVTS